MISPAQPGYSMEDLEGSAAEEMAIADPVGCGITAAEEDEGEKADGRGTEPEERKLWMVFLTVALEAVSVVVLCKHFRKSGDVTGRKIAGDMPIRSAVGSPGQSPSVSAEAAARVLPGRVRGRKVLMVSISVIALAALMLAVLATRQTNSPPSAVHEDERTIARLDEQAIVRLDDPEPVWYEHTEFVFAVIALILGMICFHLEYMKLFFISLAVGVFLGLASVHDMGQLRIIGVGSALWGAIYYFKASTDNREGKEKSHKINI